MERPLHKPIGTALKDLDTPSLFVDRDAYRLQWESIFKILSLKNRTVRSNASIHRTPALAHFIKQGRIKVETLSEALIFSTQGFHNVLVSRLPAKDPNNLLESLILQCDLTVCANDLDHARNLVTYRNEKGLDFKILVRIALREIQRGISLEDYLKNLNESRSPIKYDGLFIEWDDSCTREDAEMFDQCSAGSEGVAGISEGRIIVAACASTKSVLTLPNSVTETIDGQSMWSFEKHIRTENTEKIVLGVVSSVISAPEQGLAFIDCGQKSISIDDGLPSIVGEDFLYVEQMSAEHGFLTIGDPDSSVGLADRVILNPSNISDTCNLYDYMHVLSKERLVSVWKIEARGQYF